MKNLLKSKQERLIIKQEKEIKRLSELNSALQIKISESLLSIGQWQNKLYNLQTQHDALRVAQTIALEPFKNLLQYEAGVFIEANKIWKEKFDDIYKKIETYEDFRAELEVFKDQYNELLKRVE